MSSACHQLLAKLPDDRYKTAALDRVQRLERIMSWSCVADRILDGMEVI